MGNPFRSIKLLPHQLTSQSLVLWLLYSILVFTVFSCAHPVAPTGGPKDEKPPRIVRSLPPNRSTGFNEKEIRIWFDEYIQLKNLTQQFLSSPPLAEMPEIKLKGKSLVVPLPSSLIPNTTYTLYFGDAITDFNENNPLPNYSFIFSTGPILDSMMLDGQVINAYTLEPEKDLIIMLFANHAETAPLSERPAYISKTDKDGVFRFRHLRDTAYRIFALRDVNANLIYDLPNEEIAFADSLILPYFTASSSPAIPGDSLIQPVDGHLKKNGIEPVGHAGNAKADSGSLVLRLFSIGDTVQRVLKIDRPLPYLVRVYFKLPAENIEINAFTSKGSLNVEPEWNTGHDTLWCWFDRTVSDSLFITLNEPLQKPDTLESGPVKTTRTTGTTPAKLSISTPLLRTQFWKFTLPLPLSFSEPIDTMLPGAIMLIEDTLLVKPSLKFNSQPARHASLEFQFKPDKRYQLKIAPETIISRYGNTNDSLNLRFSTKAVSEYGNLRIRIETTIGPEWLIIELLNDRSQVVDKRISPMAPHLQEFLLLEPGKYKIRAIIDANRNGKWDSGNYSQKRQPETVIAMPQEIQIRANWDVEENLTIPR